MTPEEYRDWYEAMYLEHGISIGPPSKSKFARLRRAGFKEDMALLDFGCGPGTIAGHVDPANYYGVDISKTAIKLATEQHPDHYFEVYEIGHGIMKGFNFCQAASVFTHTPHEHVEACLKDIRAAGDKWMRVMFDILPGEWDNKVEALHWPVEEFLELAAPYFELTFMENFEAPGPYLHTFFKGRAK